MAADYWGGYGVPTGPLLCTPCNVKRHPEIFHCVRWRNAGRSGSSQVTPLPSHLLAFLLCFPCPLPTLSLPLPTRTRLAIGQFLVFSKFSIRLLGDFLLLFRVAVSDLWVEAGNR